MKFKRVLVALASFSLALFSLFPGVDAFVTTPAAVAVRPRASRRLVNEVDGPTQYVYVDDEQARTQSWWNLFDAENAGTSNAWMPGSATRAWRTALTGDADTNAEPVLVPPQTLDEYLRGDKALDAQQEGNVQRLWASLRNRVKHLSSDSVTHVVEALRVAYVALWGQHTVRSLEVSINRALGTAAVLGELKGDVNVILSGILCDVFAQLSSEPTLMNVEARRQLRLRFGDDVVALCDKYNRLPVFMSKKADYTPIQSENQLQMLVAVAEDYHSLYIRLADRLHTLRQLRSLPLSESERVKLAQEALNVYAPLAHRMGVMKVKGELEDLAFKTLDAEMFQRTKYTQIAANKAYHEAFDAVKHIMERDPYLKSQGATFRLTYRIKDKYQLNLKMVRKNLPSLNDVRDALGMRIIVDYARINGEGESEESYAERGNAICYHLIRELRGLAGWAPAENGLKDYVKKPKENGYRSLHQYMRHVALGTNVEIQVRTRAMHVQAELGEAAHWAYKDSMYRPEIATTKVYRQAWRSPQQLQAKSPAELLGMARQQLAASRVFVFLDDRSTVLNLPKGATALDAAFALHSDVGLTLAKVSVSGHEAALDRVLRTGDVVSFESAPNGAVTVTPDRIEMARSTHAQAAMRRYLKEHAHGTLVCVGLCQLLLAMTLSESVVNKRFPNGVPDAHKLARWATTRSSSDGKLAGLGGVLVKLATASKAEAAAVVGGLLDIPAANLTVSSISLGVTWARMQGRNGGWEDRRMQRDVLIPLLRQVLPPLLPGGVHIETVWGELVGERSLDDAVPDTLRPLPELASPFIPAPKLTEGSELDFTMQYVITPPKDVQTHHRPMLRPAPAAAAAAGEKLDGSAPPAGADPDDDVEASTPLPERGTTLPRGRGHVHLVKRPYALEAPSLSEPLLRHARRTYGARENAKTRV